MEKRVRQAPCKRSAMERIFISLVMHVRNTFARVVRNKEVINCNMTIANFVTYIIFSDSSLKLQTIREDFAVF